MKIAVIEVECHAEVLRSTILLFSKIPNYQLTIFTTPEILTEAGFSAESSASLNVILKKSNETDSAFFQRNEELINKHNYLLINTLQRKFYIYNNLRINIPIALRVHNSHFFWSGTFQHKKYSLSKYKLLIKEIYKLEIVQRKQFLKKVDHFFFPSESIINYAKQQYPFLKTKAHLFPLNFQNTVQGDRSEIEKTIIVPGKVDPLRKDLYFLIAFVKMLHEKPIDFVINLVFLGVTEGITANHFIENLKEYSSPHLNIISFSDIVPAETYASHLLHCDLILCPIYTNTVFQLSKEIYGKTKVSGGVNDAINFGKWCFVPSSYSVDISLDKQILTYDSVEDLYVKVKNKLTDGSETPLIAKDSLYHLESQYTFIQTLFK
jgi:glycosyltransferase involved in cell wall biosynthesis